MEYEDMGYRICDIEDMVTWDQGYGIWDMGYRIWGYGIWDMGYGI